MTLTGTLDWFFGGSSNSFAPSSSSTAGESAIARRNPWLPANVLVGPGHGTQYFMALPDGMALIEGRIRLADLQMDEALHALADKPKWNLFLNIAFSGTFIDTPCVWSHHYHRAGQPANGDDDVRVDAVTCDDFSLAITASLLFNVNPASEILWFAIGKPHPGDFDRSARKGARII
jgi:hypothetical protein